MDEDAYKPPKLLHSPSDISKKSDYNIQFSKIVSDSPLYTHWFAMELEELFTSVNYKAAMVQMLVNH